MQEYQHVRVTLDLAVACPTSDPTVTDDPAALAESIAAHASDAARDAAYIVGAPITRVEHSPIRVPHEVLGAILVAPSQYARSFVIAQVALQQGHA